MFGYKPLQVIQKNSDVGIIAAIDGSKFLVMFETRTHTVEFKWYPSSAVAKYRVVR